MCPHIRDQIQVYMLCELIQDLIRWNIFLCIYIIRLIVPKFCWDIFFQRVITFLKFSSLFQRSKLVLLVYFGVIRQLIAKLMTWLHVGLGTLDPYGNVLDGSYMGNRLALMSLLLFNAMFYLQKKKWIGYLVNFLTKPRLRKSEVIQKMYN